MRSSLIFLYFLALVVSGIEVTPNSNCSSLCDTFPHDDPSSANLSSTQLHDLVCNDWELSGPNSSAIGRKMRSCVSCESSSTHYDPKANENDVYWFLYNIKAMIDWCVFAFPDNPNATQQYSSCNDICSGPQNSMETALTDRLEETNTTLQYNFCEDGAGAFSKNVEACTNCLNGVPSSNALIHYLHALNESCIQQPPINGDTPVRLGFELFPGNPDGEIVATPTTSTSSFSSLAISTAPPSSSPSTSAVPTDASHERLAIGLGAGLGGAAVIAFLAGLLLYRRRYKTRNATKVKDEQISGLVDNPYSNYAKPGANVAKVESNLHFTAEASSGRRSIEEKDGEGIAEVDEGRPQLPKKDIKYSRAG